MIRYQAAAIALKGFSANGATRALYRRLGNSLRGRQTTDLRGSYVERAAWLLENLRRQGLLDGRSLRALEIGTGWMHFYGMILGVAGVRGIDLYDRWDNRQFLRLQRSFDGFECNFDALRLTEAEQRTASDVLAMIGRAGNFRELYAALGMRYVVEEQGNLASLADGTYDVVCSLDVLEHVHAAAVAGFIRSLYRVTKPGGISLHQIGLDDHLAHYDKSARKKQHAHFGDWSWYLRYANDVQYFSRVTYDDLRRMFRDAGFEEIACTSGQDPDAVDRRKVAPRFRQQSEESLFAVRGFFVHRKPEIAR
ncbi:MAG: class I SAM-dependent methyltransferase [Rhizomicrobium sp.]